MKLNNSVVSMSLKRLGRHQRRPSLKYSILLLPAEKSGQSESSTGEEEQTAVNKKKQCEKQLAALSPNCTLHFKKYFSNGFTGSKAQGQFRQFLCFPYTQSPAYCHTAAHVPREPCWPSPESHWYIHGIKAGSAAWI